MSFSKIIILVTCLSMVSNSQAGTKILAGVIPSNTREGLLSSCETTINNIKIGLSVVTGLNVLVLSVLTIAISLLISPALLTLVISLTASTAAITVVVLLVQIVLSVLVEIAGYVIDLALGLLSQSDYNSKVANCRTRCESQCSSLTKDDNSGSLILVLKVVDVIFGIFLNIVVIV